MHVRFHKRFEKRYARLPAELKEKTDDAIRKFMHNPHEPTLKNHPLSGRLQRKRSFSVTGNIRIIFKEDENYTLVLFLDVGTHNQVY